MMIKENNPCLSIAYSEFVHGAEHQTHLKGKIDIFCRLTFIFLFPFNIMTLNSHLLRISGDIMCVFYVFIKREQEKAF